MDDGAAAPETNPAHGAGWGTEIPVKPPPNTPPTPRGAVSTRTRDGVPRVWWRIVAILLALAITVLVFLYRDRVADFASYGYVGLFFVSVVGNATVLLPVPSLAATFITGSILNPLLVGIVSGAGMAVGELSGYLAGYGGGAIIEAKDQQRYQRLESWMRRYGALTIFVLSAIPNPIFDLAGIAAGASHYPVWRFLLVCFLGKSVKGLLLAFAGAQSLEWINRFLR